MSEAAVSIRVLPLFEYDTDILNNATIEKVSINEKNIHYLYDELHLMRKIVSFYGDFETILELLKTILKNDNFNLSFPENFQAAISVILDYERKTCYSILQCNSKKFFEHKPLSKESLIVTLQRYLQDISDQIIIVPSSHVIDNWTIESKLNPFKSVHSSHTTFLLKENSCSELNIENLIINTENIDSYFQDNDDYKNFQFDNNYSKFFHFISKVNESSVLKDKLDRFYDFLRKDMISITDRIKATTISSFISQSGLNFDDHNYKCIETMVQSYFEKCLEIQAEFRDNVTKMVDDDLGFTEKSIFNLIPFKKKKKKFTNLKSLVLLSTQNYINDLFVIKNGNLEYGKNPAYNILWSISQNLIQETENINKEKITEKTNLILKGNRLSDYETKTKILFDKIVKEFVKFENDFAKFKTEYFEKNESTDFIEIKIFFANPIRIDQTGKFNLNIGFNKHKIVIDENILIQKILTNDQSKNKSIKNCKIKHCFPTKNEFNSILILKYDNKNPVTEKAYIICFAFKENIKRLTEFYLKNPYFHYSIGNEILLIFELEQNKLILLQIDGTSSELKRLGDYNYRSSEIKGILSMIFIPKSETIILISDDKKIYQLKKSYNYEPKGIKPTNKDGEDFRSKPFIPTNPSSNSYFKIMYSGAGDVFALMSEHVIDFYDLNYALFEGRSIQIFQNKVKLFTDKINSYVVCFNSDNKLFTAKMLPKCGSNYNYEADNSEKQTTVNGNPILDYIYSGYLKFGPNSKFLSDFEKHNYYFWLRNANIELEKNIKEYWNSLFSDIPSLNFGILKTNSDVLKIIESISFGSNQMKKIARVLISRVPIQICTIEQENIFPLIDGRARNSNDGFLRRKTVEEKARFLSFGFIEKLLEDLSEPVSLCCIIGRQSSGKSYLMNRIFGTRFDVASTRCTDGIWMSYSCLEEEHIIVFDCEGLFSCQRKEIEEIKLISFLAALCDFTFLNQDLAFSKHLNNLLNNLTNSIGRLKGKNLFKGQLIWTIRDVANSAREGAHREFQGHLDSFQKNHVSFMKTLFGGKITLSCLNNFEHQQFRDDIEDLRRVFLREISKKREKTENAHWTSGKELLATMKIVLTQLYVDDDTSIDELHTEFVISEFKEKLLKLWENFDCLENDKMVTDFLFEKSFSSDIQINIAYSMKEIKLKYNKEQNHFMIDSVKKFFDKELDKVGLKLNKISHNDYYACFDKFLKEFRENRIQSIKSFSDKMVKNKYSISEDKKKTLLISMDDIYVKTTINFGICLKKCIQCFSCCSDLVNHCKMKEERIMKIKEELENLEEQVDTSLNSNACENEMEKQILCLESSVKDLKIKLENATAEYLKKEKYLNLLVNYSVRNDDLLQKENEINAIKSNLQVCNSELHKIEESLINVYIDLNTSYQDIKTTLQDYNEISKIKKDFSQFPSLINPDNLDNVIILNENKVVQLQIELEDTKKDLDKEKTAQLQNDEKINKTEEEILGLKKKLPDFGIIASEKDTEIRLSWNKERKEKIESELIGFEVNSTTESNIKEIVEAIKEIEKKLSSLTIDDYKVLNYIGKYELRINLEAEADDTERDIVKIQSKINNLREENEIKRKQFQNSNRSTELEETIYSLKNRITNTTTELLKKRWTEELNQLIVKSNDNLNNLSERFDKKDVTIALKQCIIQLMQIKDDKQNLLDNKVKEIIKIDEILKIVLNEQNEVFFKKGVNLKKSIFYTRSLIEKQVEKSDYRESEASFLNLINELKQQISVIYLNETNKANEEKKELEQLLGNEEAKNVAKIRTKLEEIKKRIAEDEEQIRFIKEKIEQKANLEAEISIKEIELKNLQKQKERSNFCAKRNALTELSTIIYKNVQLENDKFLPDCKRIRENTSQMNLKKVEIESLDVELRNYDKEKETLKQSIKHIENDINDKSSLVNITDSIEFLTNTTEQMRREKVCLETEVTHKEIECKKLKNKLEKMYKKNQLQHEKSELEKEIKSSCSCDTDHKCEGICVVCLDKKCFKPSSHTESHICEKLDHKCKENCEKRKCKSICDRQYEHEGEHLCDSLHKCVKTCDACSNTCQYFSYDDHDRHECNEKKCKHSCVLCHSECSSDDHFHRTNNHLCEKEHNCNQNCETKAVCKIQYTETPQTYETVLREKINYIYLRPDIIIEKCKKRIPRNAIKHEGGHLCDQNHRCTMQCPECKSYCSLSIDHSNKHEFTHRNKEKCYFTNQYGGQILISDEAGTRRYQVKDEAIAENCFSSCKRRGRGHAHLIKCNGKNQCLAYRKRIFHSETKYKGFEDMEFDEVNCQDFWEHYKIKNPLSGNDLVNSTKCNFYCTQCATEESKVFCDDIIWHSKSPLPKDHIFDCKCKESLIYRGMDICFIIDVTRSMKKYIEKSKIAIGKIVEKSKIHLDRLKANQDSLKVGIVGYTDHCHKEKLIEALAFTNANKAIVFLNELQTDTGGDIPEAVVDGLSKGLNLNWRANASDKIAFLVLDAPPHGKKFYKGRDNYPDGCPCGLEIEDILKSFKDKGIKLYVLKLSNLLNLMEAEFLRINSQITIIDLNDAESQVQFEDNIANVVCKALEDKEIIVTL